MTDYITLAVESEVPWQVMGSKTSIEIILKKNNNM